MKRTILFALMIPLLLTGCGARRNTEKWKTLAQTVENAERVSFHADIAARWADTAASFGADVTRENGETLITLTAPDSVAGIAVRAADGTASLEFDGVILSLDAGRGEALSPCGAPARLLSALTGGAPEYADEDSAAFTGSDGERVTVYRNDAGALTGAEIARGGKTILTLSITDWIIE